MLQTCNSVGVDKTADILSLRIYEHLYETLKQEANGVGQLMAYRLVIADDRGDVGRIHLLKPKRKIMETKCQLSQD